MPRYIDAYKIPYHDLSDGRGKCEVAFLEDIIKVPTADVRENIKSIWIERELQSLFGSKHTETRCGNCGYEVYRKTSFCPNCGADMREK